MLLAHKIAFREVTRSASSRRWKRSCDTATCSSARRRGGDDRHDGHQDMSDRRCATASTTLASAPARRGGYEEPAGSGRVDRDSRRAHRPDRRCRGCAARSATRHRRAATSTVGAGDAPRCHPLHGGGEQPHDVASSSARGSASSSRQRAAGRARTERPSVEIRWATTKPVPQGLAGTKASGRRRKTPRPPVHMYGESPGSPSIRMEPAATGAQSPACVPGRGRLRARQEDPGHCACARTAWRSRRPRTVPSAQPAGRPAVRRRGARPDDAAVDGTRVLRALKAKSDKPRTARCRRVTRCRTAWTR